MRSNVILAVSTMVAALFVAVQAWYARVAFVDASETRFLERKLDICFENFDAAVKLDGQLRALTAADGAWPPRIDIMSADDVRAIQGRIVPMLDGLQSSLAKASILGPLDRFRDFLAGRLDGLGQRLLSLPPSGIGGQETRGELTEILEQLSDFLGAQYSVFEGCRLVAKGEI